MFINALRSLKEAEERKQEEIEKQQEEVAKCERQVTKRKRQYIDAAQSYQVMVKHHELWKKKVQNELSKAEEKVFDELANTIHQLRNWNSRGESERSSW